MMDQCKTVTRIKYVKDYCQESTDSDTLYIVYNENNKNIKLFFNHKSVSNFETVKELSSRLRDDKFYTLIKDDKLGSVYYKYHDLESNESRFVLICTPEVEEVSFDESDGLRFVVNGHTLRVLTLNDLGKISSDDACRILSCKEIPEIDSRLVWRRTARDG